MRTSILVLLAAFALVSCDSSTSSGPDTTVQWVMPAAGSQFRMAILTTDSSASNNYTVPEEDVFRIIQSNVPWNGRDKTFLYGWGASGATYHVTFEPDGNTGYEVNGGVDIYPTGTMTRQTVPTKTSDLGEAIYTKTNYKENQGKETITLGGVTYDAIKIFGEIAEVTKLKSDGSIVQRNVTRQTWWFVPFLGFCAKTVREIISEMNGNTTVNRRSQTMIQVI